MSKGEKLVAVSEVADRMGIDRSAARKWLKKQGFAFIPARDPESRQVVNALPVSKAREALELRRQLGFPTRGPSDGMAGLREVTAIR